MECYTCSPTVQNNRFFANVTEATIGAGGAISVFTLGAKTAPEIRNNVFLNNVAGLSGNYRGGAMYFSPSTSPRVINNTLAGNLAQEGGGIYNESQQATIVNNIIA